MHKSNFRGSNDAATANANKYFRNGPPADQAKRQVSADRAASDANMLRLRNLRLAREEENSALDAIKPTSKVREP
jgi:hypothetical protein